jgi:hypothetical protein
MSFAAVRPTRPARVVIGGVLALTLAGCASSRPAADTTGSQHASTASASAPLLTTDPDAPGLSVVYRNGGAELLSDGSMILPLDAYDGYATGPNRTHVFNAATEVEQACMRGKGVALPAGYGGNYLPTAIPPLDYFGVATLADAKTYGYRLPEPAPKDSPAQPPKAVLAAFYGTSANGTDGCAHQGAVALDIDQATDAYGFVQTLRMQALSQAHQDGAVRAADAAWSSCMRTAGFDYANPLAAADDKTLLGRGLPVPAGAELPPPSPIEKHVATIDVTCKQGVGYEQTFTRVLAADQRALITSHAPQLQRVLQEWQDVLRKAAAIVAAKP